MLEGLMTEAQKKLRDEVRAFVREDVPRQLILDMDAERVRYPREFLERRPPVRDVEADAPETDREEEKVYE